MRRLLLIAGVAALALPTLAAAQSDAPPPQAGDYGADVAYDGGPDSFAAREDHMGVEIRRNVDAMFISDFDANQDRHMLERVRQRQADLIADHGGLTPDDRAELNSDLRSLRARVQLQAGGSF